MDQSVSSLGRGQAPQAERRPGGGLMLVAYNQLLMRIQAADAAREGTYTCPGCRAPVLLKRGLIVVPHFAHRAQPGDPRCPYPPESPEHLAAKALLARTLRTKAWVRRVDVEVPIGSRRADLWVETERENRVTIEVQASNIPVEELRAKMLDYRGRGVLALYVVHAAVFGSESSAMALDGRVLRVPGWVREIQDFSRSAYYGGALFLYLVDQVGVWLALCEPVEGTRQQRFHVATELDLADGLLVHRENVLMIAGTDRWFPHRAA